MGYPSQAQAGRGAQLQRGDGGSPESFTALSEITKVAMSGSKMDIEDVTNFDSQNVHEKLGTLIDYGEVSVEGNYLGNEDVSQANLLADFANLAKRNFKIVLPGARGTWSFAAFVSEAPSPSIEPGKPMTFTVKLTITGSATFA